MTESVFTPTVNETADAAKAARQAKLTKAYGAATNTLRKNHQDEFNKLYQAEALKLGEKWSPKLSPEERAAKQYAELIAKYPHLAAPPVEPTE